MKDTYGNACASVIDRGFNIFAGSPAVFVLELVAEAPGRGERMGSEAAADEFAV